MVDTARTLAALQTILADNTSGDITEQDIRDMLLSLFPQTTRGDLTALDGSGLIARLAVGAADTVVKSDGTDPAWGTVGHDELSDKTADDHHIESHALASHPTRAHADLSDAPTAAHHVTSRPYTYSITFGWDPQSPQVFAP